MKWGKVGRQGLRLATPGISSTRVAAAGVAVVLVAVLAFYLLSPGPSPSPSSQASNVPGTTTSTSKAPTINITQAYLAHLVAFGNRTICNFSATCVYSYAVLNDYNNQSIVVWGGNSSALNGGRHSGLASIQSFYQSLTTLTQSMSTKVLSLSTSGSQLNIVMNVTGVSGTLGRFGGTVNAQATYASLNGGWSISKEVWTFTVFHAQYPPTYQPYVSNYASG